MGAPFLPCYRVSTLFLVLPCLQVKPGALFCKTGLPAVSLLPQQLLARSRAAVLVDHGALERPSRPRSSLAEAVSSCNAAMDAVASTQRQAHVSATVSRRESMTAELQAFFDSLPEEMGVNLLTCGPEHVLWFAQQQ